jgi:drug/metabolite transporter (DMT)-like permease
MNLFFLALLSVSISVCAQFLLKKGLTQSHLSSGLTDIYSIDGLWLLVTNLYILSGFMMYGLGAVVWLGVLSKWDVSKAYPLVGLGFMLTVMIGFMLGEQITSMRVVGIAMISIGVWLVATS